MDNKAVANDALKDENSRICGQCKKKPTITPKHSLCSSCMGSRAWSKKGDKKKGTQKPEKKRAKIKVNPKRALPAQPMALTIDFGNKYASILREVEKLADQEIRPVELQVIYMLKTCLATAKAGLCA